MPAVAENVERMGQFDHRKAGRLAGVASDRVAGDHAQDGLDVIGHVVAPQDLSEAMSMTTRYFISLFNMRS